MFACGNDTESTVPLEVGEHITYGNYQGEDIVWRVVDKKQRYYCSVNTVWMHSLLTPVEKSVYPGKTQLFKMVEMMIFITVHFQRKKEKILYCLLPRDLQKIMKHIMDC